MLFQIISVIVYITDEDRAKWDVIKLQPGTRNVGWLTYSRRAYCEEVLRGYLTNCN